jgi:hypothetical protein
MSLLAIKAAHHPGNAEDLQLLAALRVGQFEALTFDPRRVSLSDR